MKRLQRRSKQKNLIRIGGIATFVLLMVLYAENHMVQANSITQTEIYTSTESVLDKSYDELIGSLDESDLEDYLSTLETESSYIIPGINQTNIRNENTCNGMIPQGICVAEEYMLISAYDKSHMVVVDSKHRRTYKQRSVLYVMDMETSQYLTTITLDTKSHVGALAYNPDDRIIYVADSNYGLVQCLAFDKVVACVQSGHDAGSDILQFENQAIDTQGYVPSFLAYYQEHLYVGQFSRISWKDLFRNKMAVFQRDGTLLNRETISLPYYAQGVSFADWNDKTYMLISSSYGRDKLGKMYIYEMACDAAGVLQKKRRVGKFACPNMSEDIDVQGDYIYTCFESASNFYRLNLDDNGESSNVVDRIMVSSFKKTMGRLITGNAERFIHRICELPMWEIKRTMVALDEDERRRLSLSLI